MLCCNPAVFVVFAVLALSVVCTTRVKRHIKGRHLIASGTHKAVNFMRHSQVQLLPALRVLLIPNTTAYNATTYTYIH